MTFASSLVKVRLRIGVLTDRFFLAVDQAEVLKELKSYAAQKPGSFQVAGETIEASGMLALHELADRAFQLARSMPTLPLDEYRAKIAKTPSTEVERLVKQRVGQDVFRSALDDYWQGRCAVTGVADRALLRASHIVPWAECVSDDERLDVFNGILLVADLDAAFDAALISFNEQGAPLLSARLSADGRAMLVGKLSDVTIRLTERHKAYLNKHRARFEALSQ
jgi:putative restriction endonuclease